jgi:hypothetical protein
MSPEDGTTGSAARAGALESGAVEREVARGGAVEGVVALPNDPKAIEELIARRRERLAATVDELVVRAHPKEIARRSAADAKGRLQAFAATPEGDLRSERLAAVAAAAVAFVGLLLLLRSRRGRAR